MRAGRWGLAVAGLSLAFVALRLWMSREMGSPFIFSDEIGYLLDARYLSGVDPPPQHPFVPFYSVGYPLLLAPLSWIFENPIGVYHGALAGNALLGGATIPLLYLTGREVFGLSPKQAFFAAGLAGAYPAFLLHGNIVWAENLLPPLVTLHVLLIHRALSRGTLPWVLGPAVTGAALYLTHPRTISIVVVTVILFAVVGLRRVVPIAYAGAGLLVMSVLLALGDLLNDHVQEAVYRGPVGGGPSRTEGTSDFVVESATDPSSFGSAFMKAFGQAWYLCTTSAGLWAIGAGFLVHMVWRHGKGAGDSHGPARAYTAGFTLLAVFASFVPNALIIAQTGSSSFYAIYGRYMETLSPVMILAGAGAIFVLEGRRRRVFAVGGAATAILLLTLLLHLDSPMLDKAPLNPVAVLAALYPGGVSNWVDLTGFDLLRAAALALAGLTVFAVVPARRAALAACVVGAAFVFSALVTAERTIQPFAKVLPSHETLQNSLDRLPAGEPVSFELSSWLDTGFPQYQFLLDDRRFLLYDLRLGERPASQVVLGKLDDSMLRLEGARIVAFETHRDQALWIRPGSLQRRYRKEGRVFPENPGDPLPAKARHSLITVADARPLPLRIQSGQSLSLNLLVTHTGTASPWRQPGIVPQTQGGGSVFLTGSWYGADGEGKRVTEQLTGLPRTLAPGATVGMRHTLTAADRKGRGLAPGRYVVELSPRQEGMGRFSQSGDDPLLVPVEVTPG